MKVASLTLIFFLFAITCKKKPEVYPDDHKRDIPQIFTFENNSKIKVEIHKKYKRIFGKEITEEDIKNFVLELLEISRNKDYDKLIDLIPDSGLPFWIYLRRNKLIEDINRYKKMNIQEVEKISRKSKLYPSKNEYVHDEFDYSPAVPSSELFILFFGEGNHIRDFREIDGKSKHRQWIEFCSFRSIAESKTGFEIKSALSFLEHEINQKTFDYLDGKILYISGGKNDSGCGFSISLYYDFKKKKINQIDMMGNKREEYSYE